MRRLAIAVIALALSGCAQFGLIEQTLSDKRDAAYHQLGDLTEAFQCDKLSMREWQLRYGNTAERAQAWKVLCSRSAAFLPVN